MTQSNSSDAAGSRQLMWRALLWSLTAFLAWTFIAQRIWPPPPPPADDATTEAPALNSPIVDSGTRWEEAPGAAPTTTGATSPADSGGYQIHGSDTEQTILIGAAAEPVNGSDPAYPLGVTVSSLGASVEGVTLSRHRANVESPEPYSLLHPLVDAVGTILHRSYTLERIFINERELDLTSTNWHIEKRDIEDGTSVVCSLDVTSGETPVARLTRVYEVPAQSPESLRSDLWIDLQVENLTDAPLSLRWIMHGPVGIQKADSRFDDRGLFSAVREPDSSESTVTMTRLAGFDPFDDPIIDDDEMPGQFSYAALGNKFFTAVIAPVSPDRSGRADYIKEIQRVSLEADRPSQRTTDPPVTVRFISRTLSIQPGQTGAFSMACYLGSKSRAAFKNVPEYLQRNYYGQIPASFQVGLCAVLTPGWLVEFMIRLLGWFYAVVPNYGIAIIMLVLVVRSLLHPLTKKTQVNMIRMQKSNAKLAPKIAELKKRFANDKTRFHQEQMNLMRESGINPATQMFSCLPMFIQMPIWIALYTSLNYNIDMRHQPFLLWIHDLTVPDGLMNLFDAPGFSIPLLGQIMGPITTLNVLPILLAVSMFAQQKLMPRPTPAPQADSSGVDQAAQMQKMMPFMSIMFAFFLYNMPSGLTLYIMASTLFGTLEQLHIRRHVAKEDDRGPAPPRKPKPPGRQKQGYWAKLQKMAEEAQRQRRDAR